MKDNNYINNKNINKINNDKKMKTKRIIIMVIKSLKKVNLILDLL